MQALAIDLATLGGCCCGFVTSVERAGVNRIEGGLYRRAIPRNICTNRGIRVLMGEDHPPEIIVPAELVAPSRPARHSVPLARAKQKLRRSHPYRLVVVAALLTLALGLCMVFAINYVVEAGHVAGYRLVCVRVGMERSARVECHWEAEKHPDPGAVK